VDVPIEFISSDPENDSLVYIFEYATDGNNWKLGAHDLITVSSASVSENSGKDSEYIVGSIIGAESQGLDGLPNQNLSLASPDTVNLVWYSLEDLPDFADSVFIRITPIDNDTGSYDIRT